ncbi:MAG: guanosine monophosphate reductase [Acidobacteria bacterium]|nr:guanosine monophosphate reductase [Acidobacteriota bacterium]
MKPRKAYSFDDVMLVPRYSEMNSRADADLSTTVAGIRLRIPIIAANMSSVCEEPMAITLGELGGLGILHRMCSVDKQAAMVKKVRQAGQMAGFSIGVGTDWRERMEACRHDACIVCLDVAHGHHRRVVELLHEYFALYSDYPIIIGQIATAKAAGMFIDEVVPEKHHPTVAFKTSIGGGSLCTTRIKTGFGVPTLQAIWDIAEVHGHKISIIGDGGIKNSGDLVKSLAAGADAVMLGNLLAGTDESPGNIIKSKDLLYKVYRGSASFGDKALRGEETRNVEGEEALVPYKGSVKRVVSGLLDGVRSGFSYGGAASIHELQAHAEFVEITAHGFAESLPHGK